MTLKRVSACVFAAGALAGCARNQDVSSPSTMPPSKTMAQAPTYGGEPAPSTVEPTRPTPPPVTSPADPYGAPQPLPMPDSGGAPPRPEDRPPLVPPDDGTQNPTDRDDQATPPSPPGDRRTQNATEADRDAAERTATRTNESD